MAWVGGIFVLLTISVNIDERMAVKPTAPSTLVSMSSIPYGLSKKPLSQQMQSTAAKKISAAVTTPANQTQKSTTTNSNARSKHSIRESIVILSPNSEREAQEIYENALKQFDSYGVSTRQMCAVWEKQGCQCSGTVEELTLSCRAIGLNKIPTDLPKSLIKL